MNLDEYLAVPYVLDVRAVQGPDGTWLCELEYEEIPGCVARARSPLDALDELEATRVAYLAERVEANEELKVPRSPLRNSPYGQAS